MFLACHGRGALDDVPLYMFSQPDVRGVSSRIRDTVTSLQSAWSAQGFSVGFGIRVSYCYRQRVLICELT